MSLTPQDTSIFDEFHEYSTLDCVAALKESQTPEAWGQGAQAGLDAIKHYGGAKPGERTMLDALAPAIETFCSQSRSGLHFLVVQQQALKHIVF